MDGLAVNYQKYSREQQAAFCPHSAKNQVITGYGEMPRNSQPSEQKFQKAKARINFRDGALQEPLP